MNSLLLSITRILGILMIGYFLYKQKRMTIIIGINILLLIPLMLNFLHINATRYELALQLTLPGLLMFALLKLQGVISKRQAKKAIYICIIADSLLMLFSSYARNTESSNLLLHFNTVFIILFIIAYIYITEINSAFKGQNQEKYFIIQIVYCYFCYVFFKSFELLALLHYPQMAEIQLSWLTQFPLFIILILLAKEFRYQIVKEGSEQDQLDPIDQNLLQLAKQIEYHFNDEKVYLESDLSLTQFCAQLNVPQAEISKVLHQYFKKNFYQLLAEYRIQHAVEIIKAKKHITIQSIAYDSGFNSTPVFNRHFKNIVGLQPSQYLKSLQQMQKS